MSKVLISFLGVGDAGSRRYKSIPYRFGKRDVTNSFISLAIKDQYNIDKMIMIGTKGSVWENFYNALTGLQDDTYFALRKECTSYTLIDELGETTNEPSIVYKEAVENAMGGGSKVEIITYGCNEAAQRYNAERIMEIEQYLDKGDEVYVDITHSFRSLPMYLMNCLIYIQRVKNINISKILYGMHDPRIPYVPVVELNSALDIYDWISGIDALMNYGNGYEIYDKLRNLDSEEDKEIAEYVADYSDVFNVSNISNIREVVEVIKKLDASKMQSKMGQLALSSIIDECKLLDNVSNEQASSYLLQLSQMQFDRKNYGTAFLAFKEAIIYYVFENRGDNSLYKEVDEELSKNISYAINGCSYTDRVDGERKVKNKQHPWWNITREDNPPTQWVKKCLKGKDDLIFDFYRINDYRNAIAHLKESNAGFIDMINDLDEALKKASEYLY